jgi:predicted dehydrogenase/aryl-alcohol dehydrogenase-like predicted oxidoreductase
VTSAKIRWGILATGNIAAQFASDLQHSHSGILGGAASRQLENAEAFCQTHGGTASDSYEALLQRDDIDAVYIATPHDSHIQWAYRALEAGKPVLCEKPLGLNQGEVLALYGEAARRNVLLVEALMYLMHPRMHLAKQLLDDGNIGEITGFSASFGFAFPFTPEHRLYDKKLGGGGILDIGIYPLTAARFLIGDPSGLTGSARLAPSQVDAEARASLTYDGFEAELHCALDTDLPWRITVEGSTGILQIDQPWHPGPDNNAITITRPDGGQETHNTESGNGAKDARPLFAIEADHFGALVQAKAQHSDLVSPDFSIHNAYWLDLWRQAAGVQYDADGLSQTGFHGRAVRLGADANMAMGAIAGLEKPVSKLVLGTDNQTDAPTMAAMADAFVEAGGNCFDTAHIYSGGISETLLGQWMQARGLREELVILGKGAHTPDCTPEAVGQQLDISLQRLQIDYLDIYCLHRDDPQVPVAQWIDTLNAEVDAGRIKIFGGSNWTAQRIDEANAYAEQNGLQGFAAVSNNFSLARMESPVWDGCIASSTDDFRQWHEARNMALLPWSAQARGFFLNWAQNGLAASRHGADPTDQELQRVWGSGPNMQRRERAFELAKELGVSAIQIALAYVLHQSFPCFAVIGPRTPMQLQDSLAASRIALSAQQVAWLDLRD